MSNDLIQKFTMSKKIMDAHSNMKRGTVTPSAPMVENYEIPNSSYNIPQEYMGEVTQQKSSFDPSQPLDESKIKNSKLPDEIKRLMIEQPIVQPSSMNGGSIISDDVIEGAQRLMNLPPKQQNRELKNEVKTNTSNNTINMSEIKSMMRDVVRDTVRDVVREELKEAGMLVESTSNSNDTIQFKVGNHLFVGKVTKIKKLQ